MSVRNKIALVTSSTRGIGLACATILAQNGAKVYFAVRNLEKGNEAVNNLKDKGYKADTVYFDSTDLKSHSSMIDEVYSKEKKIDILVNNFGGTDVKKDTTLLDGDSESFFEIMNKNIESVYYPCKRALKYMKENKSGSIVNISSIGGHIPDISRTAYGTSKAAINHLTKCIAVQYAKFGIRCNGVMPGFIATDASMQNMSKEFLDIFLKNVPLARVGETSDIANAVLFLAGDSSSYMTGEILEVAGGFGKPTPLYGFI